MAEGIENEALQSARQRGDQRLDAALAALRRAAATIGTQHGIPEGIQGHSVEELLGRIAYVPSLARDLRRAAGQALAKQELDNLLKAPPVPSQSSLRQVADTSDLVNIPKGLDLADLAGITAAQVKQLKAAGLNQVGDIVNVPDEHLAKILTWDAKQVGKLRAAIAKASQPGAE
jgi:hypothetical protein